MGKVENEVAEKIRDYFDNSGRRYFVEKRMDGRWNFVFPVGTKNLPTITLIITVTPNGKCDINATVGSAGEIRERGLNVLYKTLNDLNNKFAFVCFSIDSDSDADIRATYNFYIDTENPGALIEKFIFTFISVCEDSMPDVLKCLWEVGEKQKEEDELNKQFEEFEEYGDYKEEPSEEDDIPISFDTMLEDLIDFEESDENQDSDEDAGDDGEESAEPEEKFELFEDSEEDSDE